LEIDKLLTKLDKDKDKIKDKQRCLFLYDTDTADYNKKFYNIFPILRNMESCMNAENKKWTESPTSYKNYFYKFPNGTSRRFIDHIKIIMDSGKFVKFPKDQNLINNYESEKKKKTGLNIDRKKSDLNESDSFQKIIEGSQNDIYSEYEFTDSGNIPTILIFGKADQLNYNDAKQSKIIEVLKENKFFKLLEYENMGHFCFLLNNDLSWINILLNSLQEQIFQIENEYVTLDSEDNDNVKKIPRRSNNSWISNIKQKDNVAMDYLIN